MSKLSQEDSKPNSLPSHVLDKDDYVPVSMESQSLPFDCQISPVLGYCRVHGEHAIHQVPSNICHSPNNILQGHDTYALNCPLHKSSCQYLLQPERNFHGVQPERNFHGIGKEEGFSENTKLRNQKELRNILEEIRFITDKIRNEVIIKLQIIL